MTAATALGTVFSSLFRVLLMPIDTCKTVLQADGKEGFQKLIIVRRTILATIRGYDGDHRRERRRSLSMAFHPQSSGIPDPEASHGPWKPLPHGNNRFLIFLCL
jgi:hypothetical protein